MARVAPKTSQGLLVIFSRIKERVTIRLQKLTLQELQASHSRLIDMLQINKDLMPTCTSTTDKTQLIAAFDQLLTQQYHRALDSRLSEESRRSSFNTLFKILHFFDTTTNLFKYEQLDDSLSSMGHSRNQALNNGTETKTPVDSADANLLLNITNSNTSISSTKPVAGAIDQPHTSADKDKSQSVSDQELLNITNSNTSISSTKPVAGAIDQPHTSADKDKSQSVSDQELLNITNSNTSISSTKPVAGAIDQPHTSADKDKSQSVSDQELLNITNSNTSISSTKPVAGAIDQPHTSADKDKSQSVSDQELLNITNSNTSISSTKPVAGAIDQPHTSADKDKSQAENIDLVTLESIISTPAAHGRTTMPIVDSRRKPTIVTVSFMEEEAPPHTSCSLDGRSITDAVINTGFDRGNVPSTTLEVPDLDNFQKRLSDWDPQWKVVYDFSTFKYLDYEFGFKTCPILNCRQMKGQPPKTACRIFFRMVQFRALIGEKYYMAVDWGKPSVSYQHGDLRILVRMLPLQVQERYKDSRADTHLWPKGTFIQFNQKPINIYQRKQQSHNPLEWKGLSRHLDLTDKISGDVQELKLCTRDDDVYCIQIALCKYYSTDYLYQLCLNPTLSNGLRSITKLTYQQGLGQGLKLMENAAIVLDSEDNNHHSIINSNSVAFSVLCPFSQQLIVTPVRGVRCKHMQCFDLRNYLESYKTVSGGRWRCALCENFIAVHDLVIDGFYAKVLDDSKHQVSSNRSRIILYADGTWEVCGDNHTRYKNRKDEATLAVEPYYVI